MAVSRAAQLGVGVLHGPASANDTSCADTGVTIRVHEAVARPSEMDAGASRRTPPVQDIKIGPTNRPDWTQPRPRRPDLTPLAQTQTGPDQTQPATVLGPIPCRKHLPRTSFDSMTCGHTVSASCCSLGPLLEMKMLNFLNTQAASC